MSRIRAAGVVEAEEEVEEGARDYCVDEEEEEGVEEGEVEEGGGEVERWRIELMRAGCAQYVLRL